VENFRPNLRTLMKEEEKFEQIQKMPAFVGAVHAYDGKRSGKND
jgi:hypothetical protein